LVPVGVEVSSDIEVIGGVSNLPQVFCVGQIIANTLPVLFVFIASVAVAVDAVTGTGLITSSAMVRVVFDVDAARTAATMEGWLARVAAIAGAFAASVSAPIGVGYAGVVTACAVVNVLREVYTSVVAAFQAGDTVITVLAGGVAAVVAADLAGGAWRCAASFTWRQAIR
jgi:hypothetical protein